jgi:hypothetical protein
VRVVGLGEGLVLAWVDLWSSPCPTLGTYRHQRSAWGDQRGRAQGDARGIHWGSGLRESTRGGLGEVEGCSERRQLASLACRSSTEERGGVVSMLFFQKRK